MKSTASCGSGRGDLGGLVGWVGGLAELQGGGDRPQWWHAHPLHFTPPPPFLWKSVKKRTWHVMTSHTPSQARRMNSSSGCSVVRTMSGSAVIIWSLGGSAVLPLYFRSPVRVCVRVSGCVRGW